MTAGGRSPNAAAQAGPPTPAVAELREQRVLGVAPPGRRAAVQDRRLAGLEREGEVPAQVGELVRDRAEDAVVVEPGLADRHDPRDRPPSRRSGPSRRRRPWPRRADGRRPRRRATANRSTQAERPLRSTRRSSRGRGSARRRRAAARADDLVGVGLEAVGVEVAVAVDEAHGTWPLGRAQVAVGVSTSRRGKSGSGAVSAAGLARVRAPGELVEDRRPAVAVGPYG